VFLGNIEMSHPCASPLLSCFIVSPDLPSEYVAVEDGTYPELKRIAIGAAVAQHAPVIASFHHRRQIVWR
jgi:hypothetical protein